MKHTQTALAVFALYGKWSAPHPVAASLAIRYGGLRLRYLS